MSTLPAHANIKGHHPHLRPHQPDPSSDYDTSLPHEVRKYLRTYGLTPPALMLIEGLKILRMKSSDLEKFRYLTVLKHTNVHLFYRLLAENVKSSFGRNLHCPGLYLSYTDKGHLHSVINNWPHNVEITVVTDGSRILGLGDLGINGMGIPVGKLALYTACAGIRPDATLPLTIDLGTGNEKLREDPLYMGLRRDKVTPEEEMEFMDEMMAALTEKWPGIVIQFEDFKNPFPALERYQNTYTCFNDDIQGTGAVILGGFINAVKSTGIAPQDQRAVFLGAGSAGVGVAKQMVEFFMREGGLSEDEARKVFYLVDSKGLVTNDRGDKLADHKIYFSRSDNQGQQFKDLHDVVEYVKPTILMGLSTIGGAFDHKILKRMGELNDKPVIFPLSNPSANSECSFEEAMTCTDGRALFASGSPFPDFEYKGRTYTPGQGNNMYVFPGIGLGAILSKSVNVTQSMIYASASSLSQSLNSQETAQGWLYPDIRRIREVSVKVTAGVIRAAQEEKVDRELGLRGLGDEELERYVQERMYDPSRERDLMQGELREMMESAGADAGKGVNGTPKMA
ncbi:MAG: hypothetical protein M1831_005688 [Alyxoria varia]|nr:MAG: hypothetical protein M1831_005688 [Alyxoria varia]